MWVGRLFLEVKLVGRRMVDVVAVVIACMILLVVV